MFNYDNQPDNQSLYHPMQTTTENQNQQKTQLSQCEHSNIIQRQNKTNCKDCGIFISQFGNLAYKLESMEFQNQVGIKKFQDVLFNKNSRDQISSMSMESTYIQKRSNLIDYIFNLGSQLNLSLQTKHLALEYLDYIIYKQDDILCAQFELYGATCLMIAAKAIEQDKFIPFVSTVRVKSQLPESQEEFFRVEQLILSLLKWELQRPTNYERLQYFLSQGIIFSSDSINENLIGKLIVKDNQEQLNFSFNSQNNSFEYKKSKENVENIDELTRAVYDICLKNMDKSLQKELDINLDQIELETKQDTEVLKQKQEQKEIDQKNVQTKEKVKIILEKISKEIDHLSELILKDFKLINQDPITLACASIAFLRSRHSISPKWNDELKEISKVDKDKIEHLSQKLQISFESNLDFPCSNTNLNLNQKLQIHQSSLQNTEININMTHSVLTAYENEQFRYNKDSFNQLTENKTVNQIISQYEKPIQKYDHSLSTTQLQYSNASFQRYKPVHLQKSISQKYGTNNNYTNIHQENQMRMSNSQMRLSNSYISQNQNDSQNMTSSFHSKNYITNDSIKINENKYKQPILNYNYARYSKPFEYESTIRSSFDNPMRHIYK